MALKTFEESNDTAGRSAPKQIKVAIAHDHPLIREALRLLLSNQKDMQVIDDCDNGTEAVRLAAEQSPDVLLLKTSVSGLSTIRYVKGQGSIRILLLANVADSNHARILLRAGANGLVSKSSNALDLLKAIRAVSAGNNYLPSVLEREFAESYLGFKRAQQLVEPLSEREAQVTRLLALGHTNREIAKSLCIGLKTVDTHRSNILRKLGLRNNSDITRFAIRSGLIEL
jgi:DNA-binding NarL/FixJ family response regulator